MAKEDSKNAIYSMEGACRTTRREGDQGAAAGSSGSLSALVDVIQDHGPGVLGMPHARQVEGKIWELRLKGRDGIARALYVCAASREVVFCMPS